MKQTQQMTIQKEAREIRSLNDWKIYAGPKKEKQWREGRSAMELANAWLKGEPGMPEDFRALLDSCELSKNLSVEVVHPELRIPFDDRAGEPRNADLAFVGENAQGKVAVTVEAKADESFGETLAKELKEAEKTKQKNPNSKKLERVKELVSAVFGLDGDWSSEVGNLRYQLLTATAGTLAYAQDEGAATAVLIIHVFETTETKKKKLDRNEEDYRAFVDRLPSIDLGSGQCGELEGSFKMKGGGRFSEPADFYIGKVVTKSS